MHTTDTQAAAATLPPQTDGAAAAGATAVAPAQPAIRRKAFLETVITDHYGRGKVYLEVRAGTAGACAGDQALILPAEVYIDLNAGPMRVQLVDFKPDQAREIARALMAAADFAESGQ